MLRERESGVQIPLAPYIHLKAHQAIIESDTMGRVKQIAIKTLGDDIIREHADKLSPDFEKNKKALSGITEIKSKRTRNVLAGYISQQMRKSKTS